MGAVAFNTHEFIKSLIKVGIDEKQAEAISAGILRAHEVANLATKADVSIVEVTLHNELEKAEVALRNEVRESQAQTDNKIDRLDAKIDRQIADVKNEITSVRGDMKLLKWMLGLTLGGVGSLTLTAIGFIIKTLFP